MPAGHCPSVPAGQPVRTSAMPLSTPRPHGSFLRPGEDLLEAPGASSRGQPALSACLRPEKLAACVPLTAIRAAGPSASPNRPSPRTLPVPAAVSDARSARWAAARRLRDSLAFNGRILGGAAGGRRIPHTGRPAVLCRRGTWPSSPTPGARRRRAWGRKPVGAGGIVPLQPRPKDRRSRPRAGGAG